MPIISFNPRHPASWCRMQRRSRLHFSRKYPSPSAGYYYCINCMPFSPFTFTSGLYHPIKYMPCSPFTCTHPCTTSGYYYTHLYTDTTSAYSHPIKFLSLSLFTYMHTCITNQHIHNLPFSSSTFTHPCSPIVGKGTACMSTGEQHRNANVTKKRLSTAIHGAGVRNLLEDCNARKDLASSRQLQLWMVCSGLESLPLYGDHLIRSFASCTALLQACQVFLKVSTPTAYTWNAIISAHAQLSQGEHALFLYFKMQQVGVKADRVTFLCVLKVCSDMHALLEGKLIHMVVIEMGLDLGLVIGSTLVHMYGKCASLEDAQKVFDTLPNPNVVSWGALITGYAQYGNGIQALQLYKNMQVQGLQPEKATFLGALKACSNAGAAIEGQLIHDQIIRSSLQLDVIITSALIDMYGKCTRLSDSHKLFRDSLNHDAVSWASFVSSYAQHGHAFSVVDLLEEIEQGGIMPDHVIFLCILRACSDLAGVQGRFIHDRIIRANYESNMAVANSLVYMYAKNGSLEEAQYVFSRIETRNLVSCSAMITGHVQEGHGFLACSIFEEMQDEGIKPDRVSFLGALKACGSLGAIQKGRQIHMNLIETSLDADVGLGNTLVDMYAKCGSLQEAHRVFDRLRNRDMVSWRAIITGYAQQGHCLQAMNLVDIMQCQGFKPDDAVYMSVLAGCSYAGLLKEGHLYFKSMRQDYNVSPSFEHYNCMIDLLGRTGRLDDAKDMLQTMPVSSNLVGWSSLLSGCRSHASTEIGTQCFSELFQLDSRDASCYMIMSSLYLSTQRRDSANQLQTFRKNRRAWKKPGEAWIEVGTELHEFVVNDRLSQDDIFLAKSDRIGVLLKENGYLPDLDMLYESMISVQPEGALYKQLEELPQCAAP